MVQGTGRGSKMGRSGYRRKKAKPQGACEEELGKREYYEEDDDDHTGLLKRKQVRPYEDNYRDSYYDHLPSLPGDISNRERLRPYWLGSSLCLILFAFWVLDSLKDPIFGDLINGDLARYQPIAKLVSVTTTLLLVLLLEFLSHARGEQQRLMKVRGNAGVMDGDTQWSQMEFHDDEVSTVHRNKLEAEHSVVVYLMLSYSALFFTIARILQYHPKYATTQYTWPSAAAGVTQDQSLTPWHVLGYVLYASIESFGSLAVAAFWSFTNTTLSLRDAESYYGLIIAIAQMGAIGGSTMVTTSYPDTTLIILASLVIILHIVVMTLYKQRYPPSNKQAIEALEDDAPPPFVHLGDATVTTVSSRATTLLTENKNNPLLSGVHLILRHNYVLLILGVSSLYEVSLTCLDFQMKILGFQQFENVEHADSTTFTEFMGYYGQLVNATSLALSSAVFPWLVRRWGLRYTLRLFPTLLLIATIVAYGPLPGNLAVLFVSMSLLKAMTYSVHDPSKEILYLPTSNKIKFKAKFWIDVVGARVAKAIGSSINSYAGSLDRLSVGTVPSLLTAVLLWLACYRVGIDFDGLIKSGKIVGLEKDGVASRPPTIDDDGIHSGIYLDDHEGRDGDGLVGAVNIASSSENAGQRQTPNETELKSVESEVI